MQRVKSISFYEVFPAEDGIDAQPFQHVSIISVLTPGIFTILAKKQQQQQQLTRG